MITLLADLGGQLGEALPQDGVPVAKSVSDVLGAEALRRRLGHAARAMAAGEFSWDGAAARMDALLRRAGGG